MIRRPRIRYLWTFSFLLGCSMLTLEGSSPPSPFPAILADPIPVPALGQIISRGAALNGLDVPSGTTLLNRSMMRTGKYPAVVHLETGAVVQLAARSKAFFERMPSGEIRVTVLSGTTAYGNGVEKKTAGTQDVLVFPANAESTRESLYTGEMAEQVLGRKPYGLPRRIPGSLKGQASVASGVVASGQAARGSFVVQTGSRIMPVGMQITQSTLNTTPAVVLSVAEETDASPTLPAASTRSSQSALRTSSQPSGWWEFLRQFLLFGNYRQTQLEVAGKPGNTQ